MKECIPTKDQKLIYLKWHDAHSAGGWHTKDQLNKLINEDKCMCEEVGWVVYEDIHLEVDVKSLDKIIIEYCNVNSLLYDGTLNLSRHLSDTIPKWARLVRK